MPSNSTLASAVGALISLILFKVLNHYDIHLDAGDEAVVGGLIATIAGYLPITGRRT